MKNSRVNFKPGHQKKFLRDVKSTNFRTWEEVAEFLGVNRSMVFFYLAEKARLGCKQVERLTAKSGVCLDEFEYSLDINDEFIPECLNEHLAEFLGIMLGDGSIARINHCVAISCGFIDKPYIKNHVPWLVRNLFGKVPKFKVTNLWGTGIHCYFYSKRICDYLVEELDFPEGKKINSKPQIPKIFYESDTLLKTCVRGLFDTDGGVHRHHRNSIQLKFTNKSPELIKSLIQALNYLGYRFSYYYSEKRDMHDIYLFGDEVVRYFQEIGSSNSKNNIKFEIWEKSGKMPLNSEIRHLIYDKKII